jgi:phosphinothricin acetyltransferase
MFRTATPDDAPRIAEIFNYYVENTAVTFDESPVSAEFMRHKIETILSKGYPFVVYEEDGQVVGYAYYSEWRPHAAYRITAETTVYLDVNHTGKGLGGEFYKILINEAREQAIHSLVGVLSLPNDASRRLQQQFGFHLAGSFRETGKKFGQLIDVEMWQLILD